MIKANVYAWSSGILIPRKTGVEFTVQCDGGFFRQVEGIFIPIRHPLMFTDEAGAIDLFDELQNWRHSSYNWDSLDDIWIKIEENLPFNYSESTPPEGYPDYREAIKWITLEGKKDDWTMLSNWPDELEGETVALIYPNSD